MQISGLKGVKGVGGHTRVGIVDADHLEFAGGKRLLAGSCNLLGFHVGLLVELAVV